MKNQSSKKADKYWICGVCAEANGWKAPNYAVTAIKGICGHCESPIETFLIPVVDYKRPGKVQVWD